MAGLQTTPIFDALAGHALKLGMYQKVNTHEPYAAPQNGVTASIMLASIRPARRMSGLAATTMLVEHVWRSQINMTAEPADDIDRNLQMVVDAALTALSADYTLGGLVKEIDLLGDASEGLRMLPGYLNQDGKLFRIADIFVPTVHNDAYPQVA